MKALYSNEAVKNMEERTIREFGLSTLVLMEHAGIRAAELIASDYPAGSFAVFCGPGNNGGDGFVIARLLLQAGRDVLTVVLADKEKLKGDAAINHGILEKLQAPLIYPDLSDLMEADWKPRDIYIDCLFGTGLNRPVDGVCKALIEEIGKSKSKVASVDIPSGIDGGTGECAGVSIHADMTVALGVFKTGHFQGEGFKRRGKLLLADIGIPLRVREESEADARLFEKEDIALVREPKKIDGHKYDCGRVLIFSGSPNMPGAAVFNAMGALKSGAGLVRMAVEREVWGAICGKIPEAVALTYTADALEGRSLPEGFEEAMDRAMVLSAGSGCGETLLLRRFVAEALQKDNKIVVLDADALNLLAGEPGLLKQRGSGTMVVLTPHMGEMIRLTGNRDAARNPIAAARAFSEKHRVHMILKGPVTLVADPGGMVTVCAGGHPAMATAGSGDVLTGVAAGVMAQFPQKPAGLLEAVLMHQEAGSLAAERIHERSVSAADICESLSEALKNITN